MSEVVSQMSSLAGNVYTEKLFTIAQLIPDSNPGRCVLITKITCQFVSATNVPPAAFAQLQGVGLPFVEGIPGGISFATQSFKALSAVNATTLSLVAKLPFQKQPVAIGSGAGNSFRIALYSRAASGFNVMIRTHYKMLVDPAISVIP